MSKLKWWSKVGQMKSFVSQAGHSLLSGRGQPTEWRQRTNSPFPSSFKTAFPMRVMIRMLATTYGESVSSTPIFESGEPTGPMLNGITYIVRPTAKKIKWFVSCVQSQLKFFFLTCFFLVLFWKHKMSWTFPYLSCKQEISVRWLCPSPRGSSSGQVETPLHPQDTAQHLAAPASR